MDEDLLKVFYALIEAERDNKAILPTLRDWKVNRVPPGVIGMSRDDARCLSELLPQSQMRDLLRGLVRYGQEAGRIHSGGSASPIPRLYYQFARLYPESEPELTAWIVRNRVNDYDPFGTIVCNDATTLAEHELCWKERKREAAENTARDEQRQRQDRRRIAAKATSDLPNAVRRGDVLAVEALLRKGADPTEASTQVGSLRRLAEDNGRGAMVKLLVSMGID